MSSFIEILNKFGLKVEEIEHNIYRVINFEENINVSDLQTQLKSCILITSPRIKYERNKWGINDTIANVYYILLDYNDKESMLKYRLLAKEIDSNAIINSYHEDAKLASSIDTLYTAEELGRR